MIDLILEKYDLAFKRERIEALGKVADEQGFFFEEREKFSHQKIEITGFKIFNSKGAKRLLGILSEPLEDIQGTIRAYDFVNTKDLETKSQSIVEIYCQDLSADYLIIEPKSTFSKMKGFFVSGENQFPQLNEFNQHFQISSKSPKASLVLTENALDFMVKKPGLTFEAMGNHFIFYFRKVELNPIELMELMDFAETFLDLLCFDDTEGYV